MEKITVEDQKHLIRLIKEAIGKNGNGCDLKHIDLSQITDLSWIFSDNRKINGDISKRNVSGVLNMSNIFSNSWFNGDISKWDVSGVLNMCGMCCESQIRGDLRRWNNMGLANMRDMFKYCNI